MPNRTIRIQYGRIRIEKGTIRECDHAVGIGLYELSWLWFWVFVFRVYIVVVVFDMNSCCLFDSFLASAENMAKTRNTTT
jgi:hypothetical protein